MTQISRLRMTSLSLLAILIAGPTYANNMADCEALIMDYVQDEDKSSGGLMVATYRDADEFVASLYDADIDVIREIEGRPIQALLCRRNDLVPDKKDYGVVSTGIPLALSQDFDTNDSDSLTVYFDGKAFAYKYASAYPLNDEVKDLLDARMTEFSARDHGLGKATKDKPDTNSDENQPKSDLDNESGDE